MHTGSARNARSRSADIPQFRECNVYRPRVSGEGNATGRDRPFPLSSIEDQGQTDRVTTPTRAGLRRCRWPRPSHAARLVALARN